VNVSAGSGSLDGELVQLEESARSLLEAFVAISSDLDTDSVLRRIVASACELTHSKYGALGVIGSDNQLAEFIAHGIDAATEQRIGHPPVGEGLLDVSAAKGETLRLEDLSRHPLSAGFPDQHPPMRTLLRVPIRVRGTVFGQLYLSEKRAGQLYDSRDELLVHSFATVAGFVIENARAYGLSERRRRWLEMFGELNELLMPPISLDAALERIAEAVRDASGAQSASVVQVPEQGEPFAAAICGEPLTLGAAERDLFNKAVRGVVESGEVTEMPVPDVGIAVLAPLRAHLTMPGVLVLTRAGRSGPSELEERELLASFADQAALALDRTQALEDREEMAVISDRDRIARDLHDVVIQRLFATGLHMQSIRAAAPNDELRDRIDKSVRELDQTIRDIRGTIFELQTRPRSSLRTEVRDLVREHVPLLGFAPSVHTEGPVDGTLEPEVQTQMVSVLRESLNNIVQHAKAGTASIHLQVTPSHLRLKVTDDGEGIPEERHERGLRNARRRALLLGGSLDLWPNDPTGTIFVWSVPISAAQDAPAAGRAR
jgi:signal transduction histidine kinase